MINKMMLSGTDKRVYSVTKEIGCVSLQSRNDLFNLLHSHSQVVNGLTPDGRALMYRAREEAKQYHDNFGIKIPGQILAERIAGVCQMNTLYYGARPYGTQVIIAAHDMLKGATLWMIEPSGACYQYYGCAAGRGR